MRMLLGERSEMFVCGEQMRFQIIVLRVILH
jgi:hypothetical protein